MDEYDTWWDNLELSKEETEKIKDMYDDFLFEAAYVITNDPRSWDFGDWDVFRDLVRDIT